MGPCGVAIISSFTLLFQIGFSQLQSSSPKIFNVNWFRTDANGKFAWPGYGENMRVLKWIIDRASGRVLGQESPIGWMPKYENIHWDGLEFDQADFDKQAKLTLLGRGTSPEEISAAVKFILSQPSLTGQMIALDSGQHLAWR